MPCHDSCFYLLTFLFHFTDLFFMTLNVIKLNPQGPWFALRLHSVPLSSVCLNISVKFTWKMSFTAFSCCILESNCSLLCFIRERRQITNFLCLTSVYSAFLSPGVTETVAKIPYHINCGCYVISRWHKLKVSHPRAMKWGQMSLNDPVNDFCLVFQL